MFRIANETTTLTTGNTWTDWTDEDLLLEYRCTGIRKAFEELVYRYERELYNYLYRRLRNAANAEDVFQKTFMAVLRACNTFESGREFRPWLYKIAANKAIDHQRESRHFTVVSQVENDSNTCSMVDNVAGSEPEPFEDPMDREIACKVRDAVDELPAQLRQAVYMVYFQGLTYREAADAAGIHPATMGLRVQNAVRKLNYMLKNVG